jgi:hypothetical protein
VIGVRLWETPLLSKTARFTNSPGENVTDNRGERLSAVNVRKAIVTGEARRREQAADSRKNLCHEEASQMKVSNASDVQRRRK